MGDFDTEPAARQYIRMWCLTPKDQCPHRNEHGFRECPINQEGLPDCFTPKQTKQACEKCLGDGDCIQDNSCFKVKET